MSRNNQVIEAIVLKTYKVRDHDLFVIGFSKEIGKFTANIRGIRKLKSKMIGKIEVLRHIRCLIHPGEKSNRIIQVIDSHSFFPKINNFRNHSLAYELIEIVNLCLKEEQKMPEIFELLLDCLESLKRENSIEIVSLAFQIKFFTYLGILSSFFTCTSCAKKFRDGIDVYFSFGEHGILCESCVSVPLNTLLKLSFNDIKLLFHLQNNSLLNIMNITLRKDHIQKISHITTHILNTYTEKKLRCKEVFSKIESISSVVE